MNINIEEKEKIGGEAEFLITIPFADQKSFLDHAAKRLSSQKPIKGFRPGNTPFEVVKKTYGGGAILAEALEDMVRKSYQEMLKQKQLFSIGPPQIEITKQAFGNELAYKVKVALYPDVRIGDMSNVKVKKKKVIVDKKDVDRALSDLRKMRAKEALVGREAQKQDRVEIDFTTTIQKVPLEGGSGRKYPLVIGDGQMIPGFEEQLIGMKAGHEKKFALPFPDNYRKDLAGKKADFKVKMVAVYERILPDLDDKFAKTLGQKDLRSLRGLVEQNMLAEAENKERERQEIAMLDALVTTSTFGPLPRILIENEVHRIVHELEQDLKERGVRYSDYLAQLGKTKEDMEKEYEPLAEKRVKTALLNRKIAEQEKLFATEDEVEKEIARLKEAYKDNKEVLKNLSSDDYKSYITHVLSNKKVVAYLRKKIIEKNDGE